MQFLNSSATLRLFQNAVVPDPSLVLSAIQESTFPGYGPLSLVSAFQGPYQSSNGVYQIYTNILSFTCTGGPGQLAYGYYLTGPDGLLYSSLFANPLTVVNATTVKIQIYLQEQSLAIACP